MRLSNIAAVAAFVILLLRADTGLGVHLRPKRQRPVNLLVNGSFEEGPYPGKWKSLDPGATDIKGWKVTRGQIDYIETIWPAFRGKRSVDLNGSPGFGGLAQTFPTQKGKTYAVSLFLAGSPGSGQRKVGLRAAGASAEFHCDGNKSTYEKMAWAMYTWEFAAAADKTTLEIHSLDNTDPLRGAAVDNVSVVLNER